MKRLSDIVGEGKLVVIQRGATVREAASLMSEKNVGMLAVLEGERLVGLVSERDVVRRVVCRGLDPAKCRVDEIMTADIVVAQWGDDYRDAMRKMDRAKVRHLPVVKEQRLVAIVSMRDLMRVDLQSKEEEIKAMHDYLFFVTPENAPKVSDKD